MATEQALREKLMERAEQHKYARELFEILNSDGFLPAKDLRDRTHLMQSKLDKGKENVSSTIRSKFSLRVECWYYPSPHYSPGSIQH